MNFFDLTAETLADYVAENRAFSGLWLFHHIPKTAGSSLAAELSLNAAPFMNILPDYQDTAVPFPVLLEQAFKRFLKRLQGADSGEVPPLRAASGHLHARYVRQTETLRPQTRFFTFLRHPVSRILSEYTYSCSPEHPPFEAFRTRYPTFESFAANPEEHNKMAYFLFGPTAITPEEAIAEVGQRYRLIGLQERYPASFLMLSSMLWEPTLPKVRVRVSSSDGDGPPISAALRKSILDTNKLDLALFNAVETVYSRIAPAIWENLRPAPTV